MFASCCRPKREPPNKDICVPWVWIGGLDSEGAHIDLTDRLSGYLAVGDRVTDEFLKELEPRLVSCTYIDFKTLNEMKIPIEGIQI
jgi:hypothetical protein